MRECIFATSLAVCAAALHGQSTCPAEPDWNYVVCSMHEAIEELDRDGFDLTFAGKYGHTAYEYIVTAGQGAVRIRLQSVHNDRDLVAYGLAAVWAAQPLVLRRSTMLLTLGDDPDAPLLTECEYMLCDSSYEIEPHNQRFEQLSVDWLVKVADELVTGAMCEVIDMRGEFQGSGRFSNREDWRRVVDADNDYVSETAKLGRDLDFVESCAAHVLSGVGGDRLTDAHRAHIERTMPNRSAYFDKLFATWNGLIDFD